MKGFVKIFEVILAISIIFVVLNNVYTALPPRYMDTQNVDRLHRTAEDISFSLCYNFEKRASLVDGRLPSFDLNLPQGLDYHIYVYTNNSRDWKLDDLINETGNTTSGTMATSSCLISGNFEKDLGECSGDCTINLAKSDDTRVSLTAGNNFTILFEGSKTAPLINFTLEGLHSESGNTQLFFWNGTDLELITSYDFNLADEVKYFDLTSNLPDARGDFNLTIHSTVDANYDYASLETDIYSPKKIVVGVWNLHGN